MPNCVTCVPHACNTVCTPMILILIPLLSLLYRRTKAVRITSPQNFSSHHHWGVNQVDQPLEIALFLHHTEASHLLSASNSDTLISCCCHWSTGSQCIKSESNSLRTYLEKEGNIEFQLYLLLYLLPPFLVLLQLR